MSQETRWAGGQGHRCGGESETDVVWFFSKVMLHVVGRTPWLFIAGLTLGPTSLKDNFIDDISSISKHQSNPPIK